MYQVLETLMFVAGLYFFFFMFAYLTTLAIAVGNFLLDVAFFVVALGVYMVKQAVLRLQQMRVVGQQ